MLRKFRVHEGERTSANVAPETGGQGVAGSNPVIRSTRISPYGPVLVASAHLMSLFATDVATGACETGQNHAKYLSVPRTSGHHLPGCVARSGRRTAVSFVQVSGRGAGVAGDRRALRGGRADPGPDPGRHPAGGLGRAGRRDPAPQAQDGRDVCVAAALTHPSDVRGAAHRGYQPPAGAPLGRRDGEGGDTGADAQLVEGGRRGRSELVLGVFRTRDPHD